MNLLRYIKGFRRGKEAHAVELEAMRDNFLSEALDGYDAIDDNHLKQIIYIQKQIKNYKCKKNKTATENQVSKRTPASPKKKILWKKWSATAIFLLCLSSGIYFFVENYKSFSKHQPFVLPEYRKKAESVKNEIADTVKLQPNTPVIQDTLIIYMPPPPSPKNIPIASVKILHDSLKEERKKIEIVKLDAPRVQLPANDAIKPELLK